MLTGEVKHTMPIKIPDSLPARATLESENIFVMTEYRAMHQDIRPLNVLILNLMPTKIVTETQILRKLSNTPLQVQVELLRTSSYQSQHTDEDHLESFYTTFDQVRGQNFDGMIITGAPVENLDFTQVDYWEELCEIMAWTKTHVHSTLHICWGAQAGLYYHYGVEKHTLPAKLFGVFDHRVLKPSSPLFRGFDDVFQAPHSRYTEVYESDIRTIPELELLSVSGDREELQLRDGADVALIHLGVPGVGGLEYVVKAPEEGGAGLEDPVVKDAEELGGQGVLLYAVVIVEAGLGAPADVEGGVDMGFGPGHDLAELLPVVHLGKVQILHRGAGDNHAVEVLAPDLVKGGVEGLQMVLIRVLRLVAGGAQEFHLYLEGGVGELSQDLGLRDDFCGHQVENQYIQRADVLVHGPVFRHDKDVFTL